ncbi:MAG: hypothetical protein JXQ75_22150 [Phycisphaerae bacterium]|nr:hypothetical protein [Phycisphaerae bacterium]
MNHEKSSLYRPEALDFAAKAHRRPGDVLRIAPTWTRWTYWVLPLIVAVGLLITIFGEVAEYAEGPAVVQFEGTVVTADASGMAKSVDVECGDHVLCGDQLLCVCDPQRPTEQNWVRAPCNGVVSNIWVRKGQNVSVGQPLLSLFKTKDEMPGPRSKDTGHNDMPRLHEFQIEIIALLPVRFRPLLGRGQPFHLELAGYPEIEEELTVHSVEKGGLSPSAVRRCLGQDIADSVSITGPVVIVRARPPSRTFWSGGLRYDYCHGMTGTAAVPVRSERIIYMLVPWLKNTLAPWLKRMRNDLAL